MLQAVGFDVLGIGKFTKKTARKVGKALKPVTRPIGKVLRNPVVQVLNPAAAIAIHTSSRALGGKGTIKGAAGRFVDAGAGIAAGKAKVPIPKVNVSGVVKAIGKPKLPLSVPSLPHGRSTGTALAKTFKPRDPAGILGRHGTGSTKISVGPAGLVKAQLQKRVAAVARNLKPKPISPAVNHGLAKRPSASSVGNAKARNLVAVAIVKKNRALKLSKPGPSVKAITTGAAAALAAAAAGKPAPSGAAAPATAASIAASIPQDGFFVPRSGADAGRVLRTGRNAGRVAR